MVPRKAAPVVLVDDATGLAERAAEKLADFGYTDIAILDGGTPAWEAAGYVLFSGVHVPSKAFGEFVEQQYGTPHISADALNAKMAAGEDLVVLDSRPIDEFQNMCIPTGIDVPGAELAYRVHDLAPAAETQVVVNCAGRTRSIIGAQSLINAGIANQVVALENGTMGWHLAGYELERGEERSYDAVSAAAGPRNEAVIERVSKRFGVETIDAAGLARWRDEAEARSLYVRDGRSAEEYAAGHLPGSGWAPGGQLVQETETWMATLGARVVLIDDAMVRAVMTASWLVQMGWEEVRVLTDPFDGAALESGPPQRNLPPIAAAAQAEISAEALAAALEAGEAVVVDLAPSAEYRAGHIAGAWFAIRARFPTSLARLPGTGAIVFTSPDGLLAKLAAPEASELTARPVKVLAGGTEAWRQAGLDLAEGPENMADEADDVWLKPYETDGDVEQQMRNYLTWEIDLVDAIERDGDHRFRVFPA
ncbi:MAG: rhodanese-like domain-containing protein, partial [Alphaproteobacteria bacterium]|nr:rhodanese-like domain-containing protein [Alphaproteobacteria bacterium]